jgi:hypothetical protein
VTFAHPHKSLVEALDDVRALGRADALILADQILETVIAELRRDQSLPARSAADWILILAEAHLRVAALIHHRVAGHVDRNDVIRMFGSEFGS